MNFKLNTNDIQYLIMMNLGIMPENMPEEAHARIENTLIKLNRMCSESNNYEVNVTVTE